MTCEKNGKFRFFYTGNQVGDLNFLGDFNFVAGGIIGSNISSGVIVPVFFPDRPTRFPQEDANASLTQELLDASYYFIDLKWIMDIHLSEDVILRASNQNIYVEDDDGLPRYYEARAKNAPKLNVTSGEWLNANFEIGDLKITLNNRDGFYNQFLAQGENYLQWIGSRVVVKIGFGEKLSNYHTVFEGFVPEKRGLVTSDQDITVRAYDRFDRDEIPIPTRNYDESNYPFVQRDFKGRKIPIIYGDWSVDVNDTGEIPAVCVNATDPDAVIFKFKISDNSLREIGDVYLNRGSRKAGDEGPIKFVEAAVFKDPGNGEFQVDSRIPTLTEAFTVVKDKKAGTGSGLDLIIAETSEVDFITAGVNVGDLVFKDADNIPAVVDDVQTGQLVLTGGKTFNKDDSFSILTDKYTFRRGDKIVCLCKGKDIRTISAFRIEDSGIIGSAPRSISVTLRNSFWTADNDLQKLYEISFEGKVLKEFDFSDIAPDITEITGISEQTDNTLYLFDRPLSKIYRFLLDDETIGFEFDTNSIAGLEQLLVDGRDISIDDGNLLTLYDNDSGDFFRVDIFSGGGPIVTDTFNRSVFEPLATDILGISIDNNSDEMLVIDRETLKFYRVDPATGALISSQDVSDVNLAIDFPVGISHFQDGTIFVLSRSDRTVYNFNEFPDANENPGFIARDLLQNYAGRTSFDFDLRWNEQSRNSLTYFSRLYIDTKVNIVTFLNGFLQEYNAMLYNRFQKYSLFHIEFANFKTDGKILKEKDIKKNSFRPSKEFNQYFNSCIVKYADAPFSGETLESDTYISPLGVQLAGREVSRNLNWPSVYRREDLDSLIPLFVRLASAEPEFLELTVGFRFLFAQLATFYTINYNDFDSELAKTVSGRRFDNIPTFVRKATFNLDTLEVGLKLWSLGTTSFGDFTPEGVTAGGQFDDIVLTNLGTPGHISPIGEITGSGANSVNLADVEAIDAENRQNPVTGLAWPPNAFIDIIDAATQLILETKQIESISGDEITFTENLTTTIVLPTKNAAGFFNAGHFIRYSTFDKVTNDQTTKHCYFGPPQEGYPSTTSDEIEEQRASKHNFSNGRLPYVLHPVGFVQN